MDFLARSPEEALTLAQPIPGPYTMRMSRLARELHVNLVPGSITERTESGKVRNTTVWIDREGKILGRYSKLHLFDALNYRESDHVQAGDEICLLDTDIGRVGIQICYDCRFPELARTQVLKGADLLCVMACFPLGAPLPVRTEHWDLLIDSMALLNQTWVCAANQLGAVAGQHPFGAAGSPIPGAPRWRWRAGGPASFTACWIWSTSGSAGSRWAACATAARSYTSSNRKRL